MSSILQYRSEILRKSLPGGKLKRYNSLPAKHLKAFNKHSKMEKFLFLLPDSMTWLLWEAVGCHNHGGCSLPFQSSQLDKKMQLLGSLSWVLKV